MDDNEIGGVWTEFYPYRHRDMTAGLICRLIQKIVTERAGASADIVHALQDFSIPQQQWDTF
jgi:hypothetical protein